MLRHAVKLVSGQSKSGAGARAVQSDAGACAVKSQASATTVQSKARNPLWRRIVVRMGCPGNAPPSTEPQPQQAGTASEIQGPMLRAALESTDK